MSSTIIEVAKYIHDLLYEYSSVIVPELGAFSTRNKPASISEETQTISPPTKTVVFNEKLKLNDGILVGHISKMEAIPPSLVEDALKKFAAETKATLQAGEAVSLGDLGTLQYNTSKVIEFYPTSDLNLSLNSFGFQTLDLPTIGATTPPNNNDNIGAAGIGGTSELDYSFEEEKDLPYEEEIPNTTNTKRTVSSVLAEKAENLPPVLPPEQHRRSGGGWFWLLPLLILGLCFLLITQLNKGDKEEGMVNNGDSQTEESSGIWSIPPFSWFAGEDDKDGQLVNNTNSDSENTTDSQEGNTDANNTSSETNNASNDNGEVETIDTGNSTNDNKSTNSASNNNTTNTSTAKETDKNNDKKETNTSTTDNNSDANTNTSTTDNNSDANTNASTTDNNSDTNTNASTTDETDTNNSGSNAVTLTNTSALNSVNLVEAKNNEYVSSNVPKGYYIIVGAFKSQANANKAIGSLKSKGYEAHALQSTSGYYRVGIYGSTDGKTAKERYDSARANENAKAWMLILQ